MADLTNKLLEKIVREQRTLSAFPEAERIAALEGSLQEMTDLTWTDERPTRAGFWWYRQVDDESLDYVVYVDDELNVLFPGDDCAYSLAEVGAGAQWSSAPIAEPREL